MKKFDVNKFLDDHDWIYESLDGYVCENVIDNPDEIRFLKELFCGRFVKKEEVKLGKRYTNLVINDVNNYLSWGGNWKVYVFPDGYLMTDSEDKKPYFSDEYFSKYMK